MNLTVGPLPPAVYWRRRALVAGALLVLILLIVYSCGGSSGSGAPNHRASTGATSAAGPIMSALRPQTAAPASDDPSTDPSQPAAGAGGAGGAASAGSTDAAATELCTDEDMLLTPSVARITGGTFAYELTLKIKNTSTRTCKRDIGSNPQELHIVQNGQTVWSSDSCPTSRGQTYVATFGPGIEDKFTLGWDGTAGTGCTGGRALPPATYQIVAKLDTKVSPPANFTIPGK